MKAISSSITKIVALIAAMVVALGTFGLTTAHAAGYDTSRIADPDPDGTITINQAANDTEAANRTFSGYHLASLKNVKVKDSSTLDSFTVETNSAYAPVIEDKKVMGAISITKNGAQTTLLDDFKADKSYCNTEKHIDNPMGYIAAHYSELTNSEKPETEKPWGGDNGDGTADSAMRQFADKLAKALADATEADYPTLKIGPNDKLSQGLYLIRETTTLKGADGKDITANPDVNGAAVNSAPMIVSTTYTLTDSAGEAHVTNGVGTIDLKATSPTITKQLTDDQGKAKTNPDFSIGDDVYYELTATIPSYTGYDIDTTGDTNNPTAVKNSRVLKIYDKAEPGLTITKDSVESVTVTPAKSSTATQTPTAIQLNKDHDYTVTSGSYTNPDDDNDSYNDGTLTTIDLANYVNMRANTRSAEKDDATGAPKGVASGGKITVKIRATLNSDAKAKAKVSDATTQTPIRNETILGYSHIPNNVTDEHKQPGGEVYVYTYKFTITKKNREGKELPGAQFAIKNADGYLAWNGTKWTNLDKKTKPQAKPQVPAAPKDQSEESKDNTNGIFYSDGKGMVSFDGLKAGEYTIEEIASPSGYLNVLLPSFKVTITPSYEQDSSTNPYADDEAKKASWGDYKLSTTNKPLTISNDKGSSDLVSDIKDGNVDVTNVTTITQLPKTGAAGIAFFSIIGVVIVAMAALFAVRARKAAKMA